MRTLGFKSRQDLRAHSPFTLQRHSTPMESTMQHVRSHTFTRYVSLAFSLLLILALVACSGGEKSDASSPKDESAPYSSTQSSADAVAKLREIQGEYVAELTAAPNVPKSIADRYDAPQKVIVNIESTERIMRLDNGAEYTYWTFNDIVPGPMIRVQEGDEVEIHFANHPDSKVPHNIDFHAVTGPGGGADASMTPAGRKTVFNFRALHPGLYIYHCAAPPVPLHIANGMYGLILVEPRGGLRPVDKEFYIVQSEFYTNREHGEKGLHEFDIDKALAENPNYVVFNGTSGALTRENVLRAEVGETVRMFVGNAGPNLTSSFHVIGEIFDNVYIEGGTAVNHNVQTITIPAGGATIVEFTVDVPGVYNIVDHAIFRAFNKGALGQLVVSGEENPTVFTGQTTNEAWAPPADYVAPDIDSVHKEALDTNDEGNDETNETTD